MACRKILRPIPAIVGPTASGKTALSLALGQALDGEIVCCDSMQIYREMDIGTAKPTPSERAVLPHHMLDFLPPGAPYSAADYAADALSCIEDILARGKTPLLCGGTGLYLSSLRRGGAVSESPPADPALRAELLAFAEARRDGVGDAGNIDLVVRRSKDGGKSWGEMQVVWDDGGNCCGNVRRCCYH